MFSKVGLLKYPAVCYIADGVEAVSLPGSRYSRRPKLRAAPANKDDRLTYRTWAPRELGGPEIGGERAFNPPLDQVADILRIL